MLTDEEVQRILKGVVCAGINDPEQKAPAYQMKVDWLAVRAERDLLAGKAALADELQRRWAEADRNDFERAEAAEKEVKLLNETKDWAGKRIEVLEREGELKTGDVMALGAQVAALRALADEALTAIDEVESEPGAGTVFKVDWTRGLKLLRDSKDIATQHDTQLRDEEHSKATAACLSVIEGEAEYQPFAEALEARDAKVRKAAIDTCVQWVDDHFSLNEEDEQTMRDWVADDLEEQKEVA